MFNTKNLTLYYNSAIALHLPVYCSTELQLLNIILGGKNHFFMASITPFNNATSIFIAKDKYKLNKILEIAGFPVPKAAFITKEAFYNTSLSELIHGLQFPVVAKPMLDSGRGKGVLCNIKDLQTLENFLKRSFDNYYYMQIEEFHSGLKEYRVLIFKNQVIGVTERFSPRVVGDGEHTISELITITNTTRSIENKETTYCPLVVDEEYQNCLDEQGLTLESIVPEGKTLILCHTVNLGRGGSVTSLGKKIISENEKLLCKVAKEADLNLVGLDVMCTDINKPFSQSEWLILEANFNPDITLHEIPGAGEVVLVTRKIMRHLIYCYPFSYLYNRFIKDKEKSMYLKIILIIGLIILLLSSI